MEKKTTIEVRCECFIPFYSELVQCLHKLLDGDVTQDQLTEEVPHREAICIAVQNRLLFIKIDFAHPVKRWRYRLSSALKEMLNKNIVGSIKYGQTEITLILL